MSTLTRMLFAIFSGGFVGALVASEIALAYCWVGFLLGGSFSWLLFCWKKIPGALRKAWGDTCSKVGAWEIITDPKRYFLKKTITIKSVLCFGSSIFLTFFSWIFPIHLLYPKEFYFSNTLFMLSLIAILMGISFCEGNGREV
ncbi:MAG: hypothetical protein Q7S72_00525, partial [Candidatus Taylorbacteria bacterium]|nr:hypothetical protein [Candidatus Taylorbacteria bacterium]